MQILTVASQKEGIEKAKEILLQQVDRKTVLFLSGGKSPKPLYEELAKVKEAHPASIAMVDERYGKPLHENSNEKMIHSTGLITYLQKENIPFYPVLQKKLSREETADAYDEKVRELFFQIPRSVAIVSIGSDGHTAGIPARRLKIKMQNANIYASKDFVSSYHDISGTYGERITLTFQGLSMMDFFVLWVFGAEKKQALQQLFEKGSEEEIPARFYLREDIEKKTILITDQQI